MSARLWFDFTEPRVRDKSWVWAFEVGVRNAVRLAQIAYTQRCERREAKTASMFLRANTTDEWIAAAFDKASYVEDGRRLKREEEAANARWNNKSGWISKTITRIYSRRFT